MYNQGKFLVGCNKLKGGKASLGKSQHNYVSFNVCRVCFMYNNNLFFINFSLFNEILTKLHDLWYDAHKYTIGYVESEDFDVWKNYKPPRITQSN